MKKIIVLFALLSLPLFGQITVRTYSDSLYLGDSTNTHIFANSYEWLRITITSDTASSSADTVFVFTGTSASLLVKTGVKSLLTGTQTNDIASGTVSGESDRKAYWVYVPGGAYMVKLTRCTSVLSKIKYTIESF